MTILALEFSSTQRSVAVLESAELRLRATVEETSPRGSNGMTLIDRALTQAGIEPREIGVVAVGLGPGSYAGIRSAIAIAQGWELGLGTKLVGISSVEVLTLEAQMRGMVGPVTIVIDAQRSEFYQARFDISPSEIRSVQALKISPLDVVEVDPNATLAGPSAAQLVRGGLDLFPSASALAKIAARQTQFSPGEQLEPIYLRETTFVKAVPPQFALTSSISPGKK